MINARQFAKHERALAHARDQGLVLVGGTTDDSSGWFVEPTILESATRTRRSLTEELFAPILTAYVYDDADWEKTLRLVDESTPYGLAGAGFASDERALAQADDVLRYAAGNYYVNDKPGRAAVGQGVVEERLEDGLQFGEARLRELVEQTTADQLSVAETVRLLSHTLMEARGGRTSDDASLLLVEWRGPPRDDELARGIIGGLPAGDIDT